MQTSVYTCGKGETVRVCTRLDTKSFELPTEVLQYLAECYGCFAACMLTMPEDTRCCVKTFNIKNSVLIIPLRATLDLVKPIRNEIEIAFSLVGDSGVVWPWGLAAKNWA